MQVRAEHREPPSDGRLVRGRCGRPAPRRPELGRAQPLPIAPSRSAAHDLAAAAAAAAAAATTVRPLAITAAAAVRPPAAAIAAAAAAAV